MKKLFLILFIIFEFFLFSLINQKAEAADFSDPSQLEATTSCSPTSTIDFNWVFNPTGDNTINYSQYFWKTGDTNETKVDYLFGKSIYRVNLNNLPNNKTYDWYVKVRQEGICVGKCEAKVAGPVITSKSCDTTLPTCVYTYSTWSACINGQQKRTVISKTPSSCTGDPILTQSCRVAENIYNCENRSPECPKTTHPNCIDFPYNSLFTCDITYCVMANTSGSDEAAWTTSCAWRNGDQPPPDAKPPGSGPNLPTYGGEFGGPATVFSCGSGINAVWTLDCIFPLLASLIFWALTLAGTIGVIFIILGGIRYILSGGDPKKVDQARKIILFAVVGLVIIFLSFFILSFIGKTTRVACLKPNAFLSFTSCP